MWVDRVTTYETLIIQISINPHNHNASALRTDTYITTNCIILRQNIIYGKLFF